MKILLTSVLLFSTYAFAEIGSSYTDIETSKCVVISSSELDGEEGVDYLTAECPSFGGYRLMVSGGDIRYSLDLSYEGVEIPMVKLSSFHDLPSAKVEWRYVRSNVEWTPVVTYTALIYRLNRQVDPQTDENKDMLIVVRLNKDKSCVVGVVDQQTDMNVKARRIADDIDAKCIDPANVN